MKKSIIGTLGLVIGISVIIGDGSLLIKENTDDYGQAVAAADGSLSAHYENTVLITQGEPEILTLSD